MDTDIKFPIEFRMKPVTKFLALAIGVFLLGYGIHLIGRQGTMRVAILGDISQATFGYAAASIGIVLGIATVRAFVNERPKLVLDGDGIVFTPNFGAPRRVVWAEIAALTPYSGRYDSGVEIRTRAGQRLKIPAFEGSAEDLRDLMQRCAAVAAASSEHSI